MTEPPRRRRSSTTHPLSVDDVSTIARFTWDHLPDEVKRSLALVSLAVVESASVEALRDVRDGENLPVDPEFLAFYDGTTLVGDDDDEAQDPPTGTIYLNASQHWTGDEVARSLYHEIGHALGLTEDEVAALGLE